MTTITQKMNDMKSNVIAIEKKIVDVKSKLCKLESKLFLLKTIKNDHKDSNEKSDKYNNMIKGLTIKQKHLEETRDDILDDLSNYQYDNDHHIECEMTDKEYKVLLICHPHSHLEGYYTGFIPKILLKSKLHINIIMDKVIITLLYYPYHEDCFLVNSIKQSKVFQKAINKIVKLAIFKPPKCFIFQDKNQSDTDPSEYTSEYTYDVSIIVDKYVISEANQFMSY